MRVSFDREELDAKLKEIMRQEGLQVSSDITWTWNDDTASPEASMKIEPSERTPADSAGLREELEELKAFVVAAVKKLAREPVQSEKKQKDEPPPKKSKKQTAKDRHEAKMAEVEAQIAEEEEMFGDPRKSGLQTKPRPLGSGEYWEPPKD